MEGGGRDGVVGCEWEGEEVSGVEGLRGMGGGGGVGLDWNGVLGLELDWYECGYRGLDRELVETLEIRSSEAAFSVNAF